MEDVLTRDEARENARVQFRIIQSGRSPWPRLRHFLLKDFMARINPPLTDAEVKADFGVSREVLEKVVAPKPV